MSSFDYFTRKDYIIFHGLDNDPTPAPVVVRVTREYENNATWVVGAAIEYHGASLPMRIHLISPDDKLMSDDHVIVGCTGSFEDWEV